MLATGASGLPMESPARTEKLATRTAISAASGPLSAVPAISPRDCRRGQRSGRVELWEQAAELMLRLIDQYDDQTIFLWVLVEETGFPLPLPGDIAMLMAGYRAGQGKINVFWALALLELATLLGGSILYWLGARGGRPLLYRYGRFVRLDRAKLDRAERWLQGRQATAILLGRIIPGLRNVTVLAAGVFGVPYRTFLPAFALGSFLYIACFFSLGMWVGPQVVTALALPRLSLRLVATLVGVVALGGFLVVMYRRAEIPRRLEREPAPQARRIETSALAGFLATIEMTLATNTLLYLLGGLGLRTGTHPGGVSRAGRAACWRPRPALHRAAAGHRAVRWTGLGGRLFLPGLAAAADSAMAAGAGLLLAPTGVLSPGVHADARSWSVRARARGGAAAPGGRGMPQRAVRGGTGCILFVTARGQATAGASRGSTVRHERRSSRRPRGDDKIAGLPGGYSVTSPDMRLLDKLCDRVSRCWAQR